MPTDNKVRSRHTLRDTPDALTTLSRISEPDANDHKSDLTNVTQLVNFIR